MNKQNQDQTHYLPLCMSIGISLGVAIGAAVEQLPIGTSMGVGVGLCVGAVIDHVRNRRTDSSADKAER